MNQEMNSEIKLFSFQEKANSEKEIQESKESVIKMAKKYNINPKTVQSTKWILFNLTACFSVSLKKLHALDSPLWGTKAKHLQF